MEGGALFNSGVLGSNFLWWIGQISDDSYWRDNIMAAKFGNKDTVPGWGMRYKVRIMGIHDQGETAIPPEDLPWANIMYPVTAGTGLYNSFMTSNLRQGMFVFGFYMDGQNMQMPVIMGCLGNNAQTLLPTGKIDGNKVTNTQPGSLAYSGFAEGAEPKTGTAKPKVPDEGLVTEKPKSPEVSQEAAKAPPGVKTNKFGLRTDQPITKSQQNDIQNAQQQAQLDGLTGANAEDFIKQKVKQGIKNRVGAENSPSSSAKPGATMENPDAMHQLAAADVKREDKYREKIVLMKPDDAVASATQAMQTEIDNLTSKVDKYFGSLNSYIDAVSGPPNRGDIDKEVGLTACKVSKFQKIIMDKMMEYTSKSLNKELQATVAAMPSSMRYMFGDQKFLNTTDTMKKYNEITEEMCGQMEGILKNSLGMKPNGSWPAEQKAKAQSQSGINYADSNSQSAVQILEEKQAGSEDATGTGEKTGVGIVTSNTAETKTPTVPICFAEDVIGQAIFAQKDAITKANNDLVNNYNRFIGDVQSQLEETDQELKGKSYDKTDLGKVIKITDEEEDDLPQGGTQYFTQTGCGMTGGTGSGFKVNIVVPTGGLYDNDQVTINDGGTGYTASGGGASGTNSNIAVTGGSGSGLKVDYTVASGVITGITTATTAGNNGSNYKSGDVVTVTGGNADCTFSIDRVRGTVDSVKNGGIIVKDPGSGYTVGDLLTVVQDGSGNNCGVVVLTVIDPGEKKATSGPVTPGDTAGSVADAIPNIGQKLGDMLPKLGSLGGNLSQALSFENVKANLFNFELPPNPAMSDFYTLASGSGAAGDSQIPSADAIQKAVGKARDKIKIPDKISFAEPVKNQAKVIFKDS